MNTQSRFVMDAVISNNTGACKLVKLINRICIRAKTIRLFYFWNVYRLLAKKQNLNAGNDFQVCTNAGLPYKRL